MGKDMAHIEYYSAINNEISPFVTKGMDLEGISLSERSQTEKDKNHMISLYVESKQMNKTRQKQTQR